MKPITLTVALGVLLALVSANFGCVSSRVYPPSAPREWFREGAGRIVVMLGGGVYGAAMFAYHARELSSQCDVIRVQTLNVQTAESGAPMPANYSVTLEAGALDETLSILGVTDPVDIVGSSYGALVALHFAVEYPERIRTITLFEPPAFWILPEEEYKHDPVLSEMRQLTSAMTPWAVPSDEQLFRFRCLLGSCPPGIPEQTDSARAEWDFSRAAMRGLSAVPEHREDRARLARLPHPVLLLTGSETVPFHRRINEVLAREIPRSETDQLPGTHSSARTAKTEFIQKLRSFLARHE